MGYTHRVGFNLGAMHLEWKRASVGTRSGGICAVGDWLVSKGFGCLGTFLSRRGSVFQRAPGGGRVGSVRFYPAPNPLRQGDSIRLVLGGRNTHEVAAEMPEPRGRQGAAGRLAWPVATLIPRDPNGYFRFERKDVQVTTARAPELQPAGCDAMTTANGAECRDHRTVDECEAWGFAEVRACVNGKEVVEGGSAGGRWARRASVSLCLT